MVRPHRVRWLAQIAICCWIAPLFAQEPAAPESAAPKPAAPKPAVPKPAVPKPAVQKFGVKKPALRQPNAQPPAAQPPTAQPASPSTPNQDATTPGLTESSTGPRIVARLGDGGLWHGSLIRALAISPDEQTLASYGTDNRIVLWDLATGKRRQSLTTPQLATDAVPPEGPAAKKAAAARVTLTLVGPGLQFSGDGKTLAAMDLAGRQAVAWDAATGALVHQTPLAFAEDEQPDPPGGLPAALAAVKRGISGPIALSHDGKRIILANAGPNEIVVIESGKKEPILRLQGHEARILAVAVAPDGRSLLSGSEDQTVRLWDLDTGKLTKTYTGHRAPVVDLAFAADGKRFASGSADGTLVCRDTTSGAVAARILWRPAQVHESPEGTVTTRHVSIALQNVWLEPDDTVGCQYTIQTGSVTTGFAHEAVARWDLASGKERSRHVHYIPPGTTTATALFALGVTTRTTAAAPRTSVIAPRRKFLARATPSYHINLTALETGAPAAPDSRQRQPCADVEISGDVAAVVRADDPTVYLWNWKSQQVRALVGHTAQPILGGFTATGKQLVSVTHYAADRSLSVWDVAAGAESTRIAGWNPGAVSGTTATGFVSARTASTPSFRLPALSPDGRLIAFRGAQGKLRVVDAATGEDVGRFDFAWKGEGAAVFTPDAKHLIASDGGETRRTVVAGGVGRVQRESVSALHLIDVAGGKQPGQINRGNYDFLIGRLALAGRFLVAGCKDGGLRVIERGGGRAVRELLAVKPGNEADERISALTGVNRTPFFVMAPDQYAVAVRQPDGRTVRILEIATGQERARFTIPAGTLHCMGFSTDGRHFVTGGSDGAAAVWDLLARNKSDAADTKALSEDLGASADRAFDALARLRADPAAAVRICADTLKQASAPSAEVVRKKIQELDSTNFAVRQKAQDDLHSWGEAVRGPLAKAADNPNASGEMKLRLDAILRRLDEAVLEGDRLRELRCIELLEHLDTPQAAALLRQLAQPGHPLAHLAETAVQRQAWRSPR